MNGRTFVWDRSKNAANKAAHGIDFYTAAHVFNDEYRLEEKNSIVGGEERMQVTGEPTNPEDSEHPIRTKRTRPRAILGEVNGILFVVYVTYGTDDGEETRIISARPADEEEAGTYFEMKY